MPGRGVLGHDLLQKRRGRVSARHARAVLATLDAKELVPDAVPRCDGFRILLGVIQFGPLVLSRISAIFLPYLVREGMRR